MQTSWSLSRLQGISKGRNECNDLTVAIRSHRQCPREQEHNENLLDSETKSTITWIQNQIKPKEFH